MILDEYVEIGIYYYDSKENDNESKKVSSDT